MAEVSGHTSKDVNVTNVFHDVNSILCTAYLVARHLPKVINVSHVENLDLLTVTSIHSIRKNRKRETLKQSGTQDGKQQKIQGSNRLKDRQIELINEEV